MDSFSFDYFEDKDAMMDGAPIALAVTDTSSGSIAYINDTFACLLGRTKESLLQKYWKSIIHPDDFEPACSVIRPFLANEIKKVYFEVRFLKLDGSIVWAGVSIYRSPNPAKQLFLVVYATDLTSIKMKHDLLHSRTQELYKMREAVFNSMAILSEFRDRETGEHIMRTRMYVRLLLDKYPAKLPFSARAIELIASSAVLHDIGKVGIPDSILLKPGKFDEDEFEIMKTHAALGAQAILKTQQSMSKDVFLLYAREIAEYHHERWDGAGYPHGLSGDEIPLTARVMAIADVYDALRSVRPYKVAFSHEASVDIIRQGSGSHFDPLLAGVFLANADEVNRISEMDPELLNADINRGESVIGVSYSA